MGVDLLLVNPGARKQVYGKLGSSLSAIEPPIWAGMLAGFVRDKGHSVKIIDAEAESLSPEQTAEKIIKYDPLLTNIIVLGSNPSASSTPKMTTVHELLVDLKEKAPDIVTIISGLHPSALPERTLREEKTNFVCQGEGFYTISTLLNQLKSGKETKYKINGLWYMKNNKIIQNPRAKPIANLDEYPHIAWDLLSMDKYRAHNWHCFDNIDRRKPYAVTYTSLGCPFNCNYCNIHTLYDAPSIRFRSPDKVIEDIDILVKEYGVKNLKFLDELFAIKEDKVNSLCDRIIKEGYDLNIWAYARVDTVKRDMLKKMKKAGINWLAYGFESASNEVRKGVSKIFDQSKVKKAINMTYDAGIYIIGNFIFGLPDDNLETMRETLDMAKRFNFEYVNFYTAMAYPGSQLYTDSLQKGVKLPEKWIGYSQYSYETLPLPTKHLSAKEVLRFRDKAFTEYFTNPEYIQMIDRKFGPEVVKHIEEMTKYKLKRKYA